MYAKGGRGGRAARLLFGAMALCLLQDAAAANICPEFEVGDTIVQSAPGCQNDVEIPFTMKSNAQTEIVILKGRQPGATIEVKKQFALIEDTAKTRDLPFKAIVRWTPQLEHAGSRFSMILSSTDPNCDAAILAAQRMSHTVIFRVQKCEYCISEKESLHSIAARFSTHWTQIWSSNHQLDSPDQLAARQKIKLGNFYKTAKGDTWKLMAIRFGTTIERLLELNPDFGPDRNTSQFVAFLSGLATAHSAQEKLVDHVVMVPAHADVCVMPQTCPESRTAHEGVTW